MVIAERAAEHSAQQYYDRLQALSMGALWMQPETPPEPKVPEQPHVWRWQDTGEVLFQAAQVMQIDADAQRRVVLFKNPGLPPTVPGTTHTLNAAMQLVLPGEVAPAHRHTMAALRFVIDGEGGYTVVDGEQVPMHDGDLILTPGWTWHDHKNDHPSKPMFWLDGLDVPFVRGLRAAFYQDYPGNTAQPISGRPAGSLDRFGTAAMLAPGDRPSSLYSPLNVYPWVQAYAGLRRLADAGADNPRDGAILEYVNPVTGGHVLQTIACYLQLLRPGQRLQAHRHTTSSVVFVARGSGHSVIRGERFEWGERDVMAIPAWTWHEHAAGADSEAVLFSMTDLPMLEPFGLVREEGYAENGGHQAVAS